MFGLSDQHKNENRFRGNEICMGVKPDRWNGPVSARCGGLDQAKKEAKGSNDMKKHRLTSGFLSAAMVLGMLSPMTPIARAAEAGGNTDAAYTAAWETGALPSLTAAEGITPSEAKTGKEWTGKTDGDIQNVKVFGVNRQESSSFATSTVLYDSVANAIYGAQNFAKEKSGYVQFLTGKGEDWQLTVVQIEGEMTPQ